MINTIVKTIKNIANEKSPGHVIVFFVLVPIVISVAPLFLDFTISDDGISGNIISGLSLFIGFFFSLIFVISDRVQFKKDEILNRENEVAPDRSRIAKLNAYIKFGQQLVGTVSTTVYISLVLIILILLSELRIKIELFPEFNTWYLTFIQSINLYLGTILLYLIIHILKDMYDFFYGQIGDKNTR
jgi:hypothetical protein